MKCFLLWEIKHLLKKSNSVEKSQLSKQKGKFWAIYKTKELKYLPFYQRK